MTVSQPSVTQCFFGWMRGWLSIYRLVVRMTCTKLLLFELLAVKKNRVSGCLLADRYSPARLGSADQPSPMEYLNAKEQTMSKGASQHCTDDRTPVASLGVAVRRLLGRFLPPSCKNSTDRPTPDKCPRVVWRIERVCRLFSGPAIVGVCVCPSWAGTCPMHSIKRPK